MSVHLQISADRCAWLLSLGHLLEKLCRQLTVVMVGQFTHLAGIHE